MKALFQFLSAPIAAIALCMILAVAGGIENGTVPFPVGLLTAVLMVGIEIVAIKAITDKEASNHGKNPDD